jgi:eukaryotic-like serine/threonine-protein kinase
VQLPQEDLRIGKYQVLQRLASGGMGEVFLALQEGPAGFLRKVVIKRMRSPIGENPAFVEMFLNEARLAALLSHPNVVHILELGQSGDGSWFIAMEHIHGRSLREVLGARSRLGTPGLPPELAARLCADTLRGLHHAHELRDAQGKRLEIIHRDVTPENVLVSFSGMVKLVDFGIAKAVSETSSITRVSQLKGKVPYLAPEQLLAQRVDARTDVYTVGCVLYEMLSGRCAFLVDAPETDLMEAVLASMPYPLEQLCPGLPEALGAVTRRAMARSPAERFASAQEMATALEDFLQQRQARVPPEEVSRFMAGLFGVAATAPPPSTSVPHTAPGLMTARVPSSPRSPPEQDTETDLTHQGVPPGPVPPPPAPRLLGPPPSAEPRRVSLGAVPRIVEAPAEEFPEEPTEVEATPMPQPRPAREELPAEGPPARRSAWRWLVPFGTALVLGLLLALVGAGLLPSHREPPAALSEQVPVQASPVPAGSQPLPVASTAPAQAAQEPLAAPLPSPPASEAPLQNPKARSSRRGRVILHVQPPAEIFLGSQRLGTASQQPLEFSLPAGQHTLTLKSAELGVTRRIKVKVPAGGRVTLRENLGAPTPKHP